tara:strand:+ start:1791 stop:2306 length:516 start_codon:yes stop_codon:yes gene_type:complete
VFVDQDQMEEVELSNDSQIVSFPIALEDGEHLLEIEHYGKTSDDTIATEDGIIIDDTYFVIESITIDQFDLPILILWTCTLVPDWTGLKKPEGFPSELAQVLEVGTNGVWKMPFYTPVSDWLIQRRKQRNKRLKDIPVYESYEISTHSMSDYILTDDDHKVISEIRNLLDE